MSEQFDSAEVPRNKVCFVTMPYGRTPRDTKWFMGWYEVVIEPAIEAAGFKPVLATSLTSVPDTITEDILTHLDNDEMVICNLAGSMPEDLPNPSIMYQLGFRQAIGLPVIIMVWPTQVLPLDIRQERVVTVSRELLDLAPTRKKISALLCGAKPEPFVPVQPAAMRPPPMRPEPMRRAPVAPKPPAPPPPPPPPRYTPEEEETFLTKVAALLPAQPWPQNVHKAVATSLGASNSRVSHAIQELVKRGKFLPQTNGKVG